MFIGDAVAQTAATTAAGGSVTGALIQLVLIVLVFYVLLIRPQQKKMKEHEQKIRAIKVGDEIVTGGGMFAVVTRVAEEKLTVRIAQGVEVEIYPYTIREVLTERKAESAKTSKTKVQHTEKSKKQGKTNV